MSNSDKEAAAATVCIIFIMQLEKATYDGTTNKQEERHDILFFQGSPSPVYKLCVSTWQFLPYFELDAANPVILLDLDTCMSIQKDTPRFCSFARHLFPGSNDFKH
ncbi:PREDICTED: uncharacterized protein LOC101294861 [Fragaria vesca subsp. vesca]|uniref:uncharacterized protein LOC101294861 n=1 Tax=Fragaria vesca subsp. vesca TaxID=101020 RepID=UPI0002C315F9|nr:PREDICTED: uncharacterized protein LOC101294861 [Fragaria vesca subsp. vesca]